MYTLLKKNIWYELKNIWYDKKNIWYDLKNIWYDENKMIGGSRRLARNSEKEHKAQKETFV